MPTTRHLQDEKIEVISINTSIKHSETQVRKQTHYKRTHWTVEKNSKYWTCKATHIWIFFRWLYQIRTCQGYSLADRGETQHNRNNAQSLHCDSESSLSLRTVLYRSQTNYCLHQKPAPLWQVTMANELEDNLGWEPFFCRLYVYLLNKLACNHSQKNKRRGPGANGGGLRVWVWEGGVCVWKVVDFCLLFVFAPFTHNALL